MKREAIQSISSSKFKRVSFQQSISHFFSGILAKNSRKAVLIRPLEASATKPNLTHEKILDQWIKEPGISDKQKLARTIAKNRILDVKQKKGCSLNLSNLNLTSLPEGVFTGLTALTSLNLKQNNLATLHRTTFTGLSALKDLILSNNKLSTLQAFTFNEVPALKWLNLNNNQLTTLDSNTFNSLSGLATLNLRENALTTIQPDAFSGLSALTILYLNKNQLTTLQSDSLNGLSALTTLDLRFNQLSTIESDALTTLSQLKSLHLERNPITPEMAQRLDILSQVNPSLRLTYDMTEFQRSSFTTQNFDFPTSANRYLQTENFTTESTQFWNTPTFLHFKDWICELPLIKMSDPSSKSLFDSHIKEILTLFRSSVEFRSLTLSAFATNEGCGDHKAVIYALLTTALPLYRSHETPLSYPQFHAFYRSHQAVQLIVNEVINRRIPGDEAGQVLAALTALNDRFMLGIGHIGMCFKFTGTPILPVLGSIATDVTNQLESADHYESMIWHPRFNSIRNEIRRIQNNIFVERSKALEEFTKKQERAEEAKRAQLKSSGRSSTDNTIYADPKDNEELFLIQNRFNHELRKRLDQLFLETFTE